MIIPEAIPVGQDNQECLIDTEYPRPDAEGQRQRAEQIRNWVLRIFINAEYET